MIALIGLLPTIGIGLALWQMTHANNALANRLAGTKPAAPRGPKPRQPIPDKWREDKYQALSPEEKKKHGGI